MHGRFLFLFLFLLLMAPALDFVAGDLLGYGGYVVGVTDGPRDSGGNPTDPGDGGTPPPEPPDDPQHSPEPGSLVLGLIGLGAVSATWMRRKRSPAPLA